MRTLLFILLIGVMNNTFAAEKKVHVSPELQMLNMVLSNNLPKEFANTENIPFEKLPAVCKKDWQNEIELYGKEEKNASVIKADLNNDGRKELIVTYRGYWGNGGTNYDVFTLQQGTWKKCGQLFALHIAPLQLNGRHGLFQVSKCGSMHREYTFFELINGKLTPSIKITANIPSDDKFVKLFVKIESTSTTFKHLF